MTGTVFIILSDLASRYPALFSWSLSKLEEPAVMDPPKASRIVPPLTMLVEID
jgi:hypothetical protein